MKTDGKKSVESVRNVPELPILFPAHVVEGLARVRDVRGDRDNVEQLSVGRLEVRQRVVRRVHVAPERGVHNFLGALQAEVGGGARQERVGNASVVDENVDCESVKGALVNP